MKLVVPYLLMLIKFLNRVLFKFQCFLVDRYLQSSPSDNPVSEKYRALSVDAMPIIEKRKSLDYRQLLGKYLKERGKPLKPVNRRSKYLPPPDVICPICNTPYDNAGGRGQFGCKVCKSTFYPDKAYLEKLTLKCPHCGRALQKKRDRKQFFVYTCVNRCCPFYVRNLTSMSKDEKADFDKNPYNLHFAPPQNNQLNFKKIFKNPIIGNKWTCTFPQFSISLYR